VKIAFSHDWLTGMRGGEKCLEALARIYPRSEIYTLLHRKGSLSDYLEGMTIHTSILQFLPFADRIYKHLLPFFPLAVHSLKPRDYDIMISVSHCVAKAVPQGKSPKMHICYCLTPMRYAWIFFNEYFESYPLLMRRFIRFITHKLRQWDKISSKEVTHFVGISKNVQKRIREFYGRESELIYPPVDTEYFKPVKKTRENAYLIVSALVPYKRVDLAVRAASEGNFRLTVIGGGPEERRLQSMASEHTEFLGRRTDAEIRHYYQSCRGLIFPGEEDFGIVPLEAQACGTPVLAYGRGGVLETVLAGETGVFFGEQTSQSLLEGLNRMESRAWDENRIRLWAEGFGKQRFQQQFSEMIERMMNQRSAYSANKVVDPT